MRKPRKNSEFLLNVRTSLNFKGEKVIFKSKTILSINMVGEVSEDGKWIWDGENWNPKTDEEHTTSNPENTVNEVETPESHAIPVEIEDTSAPMMGALPLPDSVPAPLPMPAFDPNFQNQMIGETGSKSPKILRILSGSTGILMSVVMILFIVGFVLGVNADNITGFQDEGTSAGDDFADAIGIIQILTYVSLLFIVGIITVSVLTMMNKSAWWVLPASIMLLILLFAGTAFYMAQAANAYYDTCDSEVYYNCPTQDETMFDQDAMFSGFCGIGGLLIVGIMSLIIRAKSRNSEEKYVSLAIPEDGEVLGSQIAEKDDKKVKVVLAISVIVIILGSLFAYGIGNALMNPVMADSEDDTNFVFDVRDAWDSSDGHVMSEDAGDALVVVDMLQGNSERHWEFVSIKIVAESGEAYTCEWWQLSRNSGCEFDELDVNEDGYWAVGESLIIYEDSLTNICSGDNGGCEIAVEVNIGSMDGNWEYNSEWYYGYADAAE